MSKPFAAHETRRSEYKGSTACAGAGDEKDGEEQWQPQSTAMTPWAISNNSRGAIGHGREQQAKAKQAEAGDLMTRHKRQRRQKGGQRPSVPLFHDPRDNIKLLPAACCARHPARTSTCGDFVINHRWNGTVAFGSASEKSMLMSLLNQHDSTARETQERSCESEMIWLTIVADVVTGY